jgi:eukaryotic-like serine/threonine-protein kinase
VPSAAVVIADRYRLESRIAGGGMGEVWRAVDQVLGRPVAVKLLRGEYAGHAETLTRFAAEARHAASVSHPGIAHTYDYGETGRQGLPYLVMELVDGPSLAGILAGGPLDPAQTMEVVSQAAAGLAAAHGAGLVHRDVKPANLLVSPDGTVKITDFGIAHAAGSAPITRTGVLMGTPAYLAPERTMGRPATPASDLYSLGIAAYECLAGTPPFTGTAMEVALAHQHRPLPPLPPHVPAETAALIAGLAAKDPAARPASAAEVASRAGRVRDTMTGGAAIRLPVTPHPTPATRGYTRPVTLAGPQEPALPPPRRLLGRGRARPANVVLFTVSGAVLAAGLAGWLAAAGSGVPAQGRHPAATRTAAPAPRTSARMAEVNAGTLAGQPVSTVVQQLRQLGLRPQVIWLATAQQPPGTVISVQPAGQVPAGSTVIVAGALQPHGHGGHGHGGHGHGGDDHGGDGNSGG